MIDISAWMELFQKNLSEHFGERIWFVGLQGSYGRGEATESSDIDVVVILDTLSPADIQSYHAMLDPLPHRELVCGFLSGKDELLNWEPSDLFQFYHDTTPVTGSLDDLLPLLGKDTVIRAIKIGACNIYHGCIHNMLYDKSGEILKGLYKSASFVVQAICYLQTGCYIQRQKDLIDAVSTEEKQIIETFSHLKNGGAMDFGPMSEILFTWSGRWIRKAE